MPAAETCNGIDDDCNYLVDDGVVHPDGMACTLDEPGIGVGWTRNQIFMNNQVPREFTRDRPSLISAEQVGAEWFRPRLR